MVDPRANRILCTLCAMTFLFQCCSKTDKSTKPSITIYENNPRYFAYGRKPVLLLGGSDEDNLFNHPDLMIQNLETLKEIGGNYIRCTMSSRDEGNLWAFARTQDGKYDLDTFNPEYWERLQNCLKEAAARDIVVQIEVWATFDFYRDNWLVNPFNPANNVNYTAENTRLETEWPHHPARKPQPFFFSVPEKNNDTVLFQYQTRYVDQLLDISFKYRNVLYCMDNETRAPAEWAWFWGNYIQEKAKRAGVKVLLTEMWDAWDLRHEDHKRTYEHPDLFAFFDISQNNWQEGQTHYDNALWAWGILGESGGIRPLTNIKVYHRRSRGRPNEPLIGLDRWWQNIWVGCASTRFHRPTGGTGLNELSQKAIKAARIFTDAFDIFSCEPHAELLSDCEDNEAYCLANPGSVYAVYFPKGGNVKVTIVNHSFRTRERWFDPEIAQFLDTENIGSGNLVTLNSPDTLQTWLVLVDGTQ